MAEEKASSSAALQQPGVGGDAAPPGLIRSHEAKGSAPSGAQPVSLQVKSPNDPINAPRVSTSTQLTPSTPAPTNAPATANAASPTPSTSGPSAAQTTSSGARLSTSTVATPSAKATSSALVTTNAASSTANKLGPALAQKSSGDEVTKEAAMTETVTSRKPDPTAHSQQAMAKRALTLLLACPFLFYGYWLIHVKSLAACATQASQLLNQIKSAPAGYCVAIGPAIIVFVSFASFLFSRASPNRWASAKGSITAALLALICVGTVAVLGTPGFAVLVTRQWLYFVPVIPPVLFAYQAVFVWQQRPQSLGQFSFNLPQIWLAALQQKGYLARLRATEEQLQLEFHRSPQRSRLFAHYAVPFVLLLLTGFGSITLALEPKLTLSGNWAGPSPALVLRGLRWGAAGAFVYVLSDFGMRFFRRDLTARAAVWASLTLVLGPALAVILVIGWKLAATDSPWQSGVVLFLAGLAPRRMISMIEAGATQLFKAQATTSPPKLIPLTSLRGITPEIAARFSEESVDDATALAYCDPIRLIRNMPYDLRQIIHWIDQALLAITLPKHYEKLTESGVTGAIDLAWRWMSAALTVVSQSDGGSESPEAAATLSEHDEASIAKSFESLAPNAQDIPLIRAAGEQLFYEAQVCLLWVLHNSFSTTAIDSDGGTMRDQH